MKLHTDDAIVLTRYPFRERDLIVVLLTRKTGQMRLVARRVRAGRNPLATALEPFAGLRVSYFQRAGAELATLNEAKLTRSPFPLAADPTRWAAAHVVAEMALICCPPGQALEPSFRLVDHCLTRLAAGLPALVTVHYAELWFLRLSGVLPEIGRCGVCERDLDGEARYLVGSEPAVVCAEHSPSPSGARLSPAAVSWLERAQRQPLGEIARACPDDGAAWMHALLRRFTDRDLVSWPSLVALL